MSEMVERVKNSRLPYDIVGRDEDEWFIDDDDLPGGVFVAGPFGTEEEAYDALELMNARAAIEAMREPTEKMGHAMLMARTYFERPQNLTAAEADAIKINDKLAANPSKWCMPEWRAAIDEALR